MSCSVVCRLCLASNVRMFDIANTKLEKEIKEVTKITFTAGDGRPEVLCYMCYALVQKFYEFLRMAQSSEKLFRFFLGHSITITKQTVSELNDVKPSFLYLKMSTFKPISINMLNTPVIMKGIKKEIINIDSNTFAETVEISDLLDDFVNGDIELKNESIDNCIKEEPLPNYDDMSMNFNKPIKEECSDEDSIILEDKTSPKVEFADISDDELGPLFIKEENLNVCNILEEKESSMLVEENIIENKETTICGDEYSEDELPPLSINEKKNNIQTKHNTKSKKNDIAAHRSDRCLLRPSDYGLHRATDNDDTTFVPFAYGTENFNKHSLEESESQKSQHREEIGLNPFYFCDHCCKSFLNRDRLKKHMKNMHNLDLFICNRCDKYYETEKEIKDHLRIEHPGCKFEYRCDRCRKKYKIYSSLLKHKQRFHSVPKIIYTCDLCRKEYVKRWCYQYHMLCEHAQNIF